MEQLEQDWAYLEIAADSLEEYLLSSQLYYPLGSVRGSKSSRGMLQLTLGNLLVTLARLDAVNWQAELQKRLQDYHEQIAVIRQRWKSNWINKTDKEVIARLTLWRNCVQDWADSSEHSLAGYRHQVRWRVILHLLTDETHSRIQEDAMLSGLDSRLRLISKPGPFVWEEVLQAGFPQDQYWYLYLSM